MTPTNWKQEKRARRHQRVRAKVKGTATQPRLSVFRSNRYIYAQLVDDQTGRTLAAASDQPSPVSGAGSKKKSGRAVEVGTALAKLAMAKQIKRVSFDRGGYSFAGRIKALAEGARQGGLIF